MASHPSPFHRQRQSTKTLDPSGQTAKFLYTILKQLDLKNIDWNEVADNLGITNGHAARMRWSRFRAQIEGSDNSYSRKSVKKMDREKKRKQDRQAGERADLRFPNNQDTNSKRLKAEPRSAMTMEVFGHDDPVDYGSPYGRVKDEQTENVSVINGVRIHHPIVKTVTTPRTPIQTSRNPNWLDPALTNASSSSTDRSTGSSGHLYSETTTHRAKLPEPRLVSLNQAFPPYRPVPASNPYQNASGMYNSPYPCHSPYNYLGQQLYPVRQSGSFGQYQGQSSFSKSNTGQQGGNLSMATAAAATNQYPQWSQSRPSSAMQQLFPTTPFFPTHTGFSTSEQNAQPRGQAQGQAQTQVHAFDLASEASYPWPPSEAFLSHFSQDASDNTNQAAHESNNGNLTYQEIASQAMNSFEHTTNNGQVQTSGAGTGEKNDNSIGVGHSEAAVKEKAAMAKEQAVIDLSDGVFEQHSIKDEPSA